MARRKRAIAAVLCLLAPLAAAKSGNVCLDACQKAFGSVPFEPRSHCLAPSLVSTYLCLSVNCDEGARGQQLAYLQAKCGEGIPPFSVIDEYDAARVPRIELNQTFGENETISEVVLPTNALFSAWHDTLDAWKYVESHHIRYELVMILFWAGVIAIGTLNRLALLVLRRTKTHRFSWLKAHVLVPATFGQRCASNLWWCTIPPRIQSLTILIFTLLNVVCSVHGYRITSVNLYFGSETHQIWRYVSDRTGIISFANFPVIWLFGMRNNVALWLTGWDFGTYNNFHRWVARIATLQAVIHSVGYTVLILREGGWAYFASYFSQMFWIVGEVATVVMCLLLACSVYWLRRKQYETFLIIHIVMSAIILVTMLGHVSIFDGEYDLLFWVPVFIWLLDRAMRICRIVVFNPTLRPTRASVVFNPVSNIVRLDVPTHVVAYKADPGTFYYISVVDDAQFWESHPFTVATVSNGMAKRGEESPLLEDTGLDKTAKTLTFLIRPYDGFTRRLRDLAASPSLRVLVDGPYGHTQPLQLFDRVVFIVGGSGIVVPLSYMKKLKTANVCLHWAVREASFAADVLDDIDTAWEVDVYFSDRSADTFPNVQTHHRRPNISQIIEETTQHRSVAVVACGPPQLADDTRAAVVAALKNGHSIEYFEESFRW